MAALAVGNGDFHIAIVGYSVYRLPLHKTIINSTPHSVIDPNQSIKTRKQHATKPKAIEADIADLPDLLRR
jgi:hypothetical protein